MKLLIVIVSYRAVELTIDCLRSLSREIHSVPGTRVAVCENGTGGNAARRLADAIKAAGWGDWVSLTTTHPNRGFAAGNNAILRDAMEWDNPPEYFLLLNADTIVRPRALSVLLDAAERNPNAGIISSRQEWPDGTPQVCCFRHISVLGELVRAAQIGSITRLLKGCEVPLPPPDHPIEPDWTCFACALIRRAVVEQVGLLDEGFYLYFDDPDYCRRAGKAGWRVLHWPEARVVHLVGQSNPVESLAAQQRRRPRYYYASRARYFAKSYGPAGPLLANIMWAAGRIASLVPELLRNRPRHTCDKEWRDIWTNVCRPMANWELTETVVEAHRRDVPNGSSTGSGPGIADATAGIERCESR